jgi:hypothetical protein
MARPPTERIPIRDASNVLQNCAACRALAAGKFLFEPVAVSDVQLLAFLEPGKQLPGLCRIMAVAFQLGDDLTLTRNVTLTIATWRRACLRCCRMTARSMFGLYIAVPAGAIFGPARQ